MARYQHPDDDYAEYYVDRMTCPVHGTIDLDPSDDRGPRLDHECCRQTYYKVCEWQSFLNYLDGCIADDKVNAQDAAEGWYVGEFTPGTEAELMEWAWARKLEDDAEFDYGFNVLYKQQVEAAL